MNARMANHNDVETLAKNYPMFYYVNISKFV